ncbi:hypothetical protein ACIRJ3_23300 [Streptomyces anulatus]
MSFGYDEKTVSFDRLLDSHASEVPLLIPGQRAVSALAAVLLALSAAADTAERADTLTCMWSEFMDRFAEQRDRELSVALLPARWNPLPGAADRPRRSLAAGRSGTLPARCWPII